MGVRVGLLFLLVLGIHWVNSVDARNAVLHILGNSVFDSAEPVNLTELKNDIEADAKDDNVCTLCEQYTSLVIDYFRENKTQRGIVDTLYLGCARMHSFKRECIKLVDYYAPLFFLEITSMEPGQLCSQLNLCHLYPSEDPCKFCHEAVAEVLDKLEDPDTQLQIVQMLLKVCKKTDQYARKCKRLVLEFAPLVMANAGEYLAKTDLCTIVHACKNSTGGIEVTSSSVDTPLLAEA